MPEPAKPSDLTDEARDQHHSALGAAASRGVALLVGRGLVVKVIGMAALVVAARILTPTDFGLLAIGFTFCLIGTTLADGGLGAGLIRAVESPTRQDLRSVMGFQLVATIVLAVLVSLASIPFGRSGAVTAILVWSVPSSAFRVPATIITERALDYGPIARADVIQALVGAAGSVGGLLLGAGVWSVAVSNTVAVWVGAIVAMFAVPGARLWPSLRIAPIRRLLAFGAQFQAISIVQLVRDQGLNLGVAALAGPAILGYWSLAGRVLQVPFLILGSLWRVSYPAMAALVNSGADASIAVKKTLRKSTIGMGLVLAPTGAASVSGVTLVFGDQWGPTGKVVASMCLILTVTGPVSVACAGYLSAAGRIRSVLVTSAVNAAVWLSLTLPLVHSLGTAAIVIGFALASPAEATIFSIATRRQLGVSPGLVASVTALPAIAGLALGVLAGAGLANGLAATVAAAITALAATLLGFRIGFRGDLEAVASTLRSSLSRRKQVEVAGPP
ncbi:MAG: oligosaccharide flippase family protein [Actinomycetes bacterium]